MDRRLASLSLALTVCVAAAQAETFAVSGRDRMGSPITGSVVVKASSNAKGDVRRRMRVSLGALNVEGPLSENGDFTWDSSQPVGDASKSAEAVPGGDAGDASPSAGISTRLSSPDTEEPESTAPETRSSESVDFYTAGPASGKVEVKDGRLNLELRDSDGRPVIRVSGTQADAPAQTSAESRGASRPSSRRQASAQPKNAMATPEAEASKPTTRAGKLEAAEERVAETVEQLAGLERAQREEDAYALDGEQPYAEEGDALGMEDEAGMEAAWEQLREDYEVAAEERDALQDDSLRHAYHERDIEAAEDLVAANTHRLASSSRALGAAEDESATASAEHQRLQEHQARARAVRDRLQERAQRAAVEQGDVQSAEELVRQNTQRVARSQVDLADDEDVTAEEQAEHQRLVELQQQAAAARDRVHDEAVRKILEEDDFEAAEELAESTTSRLVEAEAELGQAWDEATIVRDEHRRLLYHQHNAVELRGHVLRQASQRALETKDPAAANEIASSLAARLVAAREAASQEPTQAQLDEQKRLSGHYRDAVQLRETVHREALRAASQAKDLTTAHRLLAQDNAELAAFAVLNQHRANSLTDVDQQEGTAFLEFQQDSASLNVQLFERSMQDLRLWQDPAKSEALIETLREGVRDYEAALQRKGLNEAPLPEAVSAQRTRLVEQVEQAEALHAQISRATR